MSPQIPIRHRLFLLLMIVVVSLQSPPAVADRADDDFNLGVGLWRKERWTPAAETFQQFVTKHPDHPRVPLAHFYLGLCWSSLQKYEKSREHFGTFLNLDPDSANAAAAKYRIGECSFYLREYDQSARQLATFVQDHPDHKLIDWGKLQQAESLVQLNRPTEAEPLLSELLTTSSSEYITGQAQYTLALSLEKQQLSDEAVDAYLRLARLNDERQAARALARAGTIRFRQQRYELASGLYDQIVADFPDSRLAPSAALNSGLALYRVRKFDDALRRFEQVPESSKERTEATLLAGMTLSRQNRPEEARTTLRSAFEAAGDTELAAEALFEMARLEQTTGNSQLAGRMYADLTDRWPQDSHAADALFNAASLKLEGDDPAAAQLLLTRLADEFPKRAAEPRTRFLSGRVQLAEDKPIDARQAFQDVVTAAGADERSASLSLYYIARIDHKQQQFESALQAVNRLRPVLGHTSNEDLRGALALGAMSAIELSDFRTADQLASDYLDDSSNKAQLADALAARTVARAGLGSFAAAVDDAGRLIDAAPKNSQTWTAILQSAERAWNEQQYEAARDLFGLCSRGQAPDSTRRSGASGKAWSLFYLQQFSDAATLFKTIAETWPKTSTGLEARYMAARSLHESGEIEAAIEHYTTLSRNFAELSSTVESADQQQQIRGYALEAGRTAARLLDAGQRDDEANDLYSFLVEQFPDSSDLDSLLDEWALLNLRNQNYEQSDAIYRRLLQGFPESQYAGTARLSLAESELSAQRTDAAIEEFEAIVASESYGRAERAKALFHLTDISAARKDWAQVLERADQFARNFSADSLAPRIQLLHADALLASDELNKAEHLLDILRLAVLSGDQPRDSWTPRIWVVLGEVALASKDYSAIDTIAEEFEEQFPDSGLGFQISYLLGRRWKNQAQPEFEKARRYFEQAVFDEAGRGTRTAARSQFLIADTHLMQQNYSQAASDYLKVYLLYRFPDLQAQALYQAGACQQKSGDPQEAIRTWQSLIEEFPESPMAKEAANLLNEPAPETPQT